MLNKTFSSLDSAFSQQARFSADVAHELRTPVSVLITEAQTTLERERGGEEYRETISACLRSARRMAGLIESLLQLGQIQGSDATSQEDCDLGEIAADCLENLSVTANTMGIKVKPTLDSAPCRGNSSQLSQIATNLLANAIQHNQPGGEVTLQTTVEGDHAVLRVENTGPGIPKADLPHVFERFYRTDASRSRKTGGVGLAICRAIADAHDAELTVESQIGQRTLFTLRLRAAVPGPTLPSSRTEDR